METRNYRMTESNSLQPHKYFYSRFYTFFLKKFRSYALKKRLRKKVTCKMLRKELLFQWKTVGFEIILQKPRNRPLEI